MSDVCHYNMSVSMQVCLSFRVISGHMYNSYTLIFCKETLVVSIYMYTYIIYYDRNYVHVTNNKEVGHNSFQMNNKVTIIHSLKLKT